LSAERSTLGQRVAEALRERILDGDLKPGDRLPSEPDLARELGVSRATVRAAFTVLEEEGLVLRRHGAGTFVLRRPLRYELGRNLSVSALIEAMGVQPGTVDARCAAEAAPPEVAEALDLDVGTVATVLRRVRTADGRRVVDSADWCRREDISPEDLGAADAARHGSVYGALTARGLQVHHGLARILPDVADRAIAARLEVPRGSLLLTLFQVDETADGRPVLVSHEHYLADAFTFTAFRRGPGVDQP